MAAPGGNTGGFILYNPKIIGTFLHKAKKYDIITLYPARDKER